MGDALFENWRRLVAIGSGTEDDGDIRAPGFIDARAMEM